MNCQPQTQGSLMTVPSWRKDRWDLTSDILGMRLLKTSVSNMARAQFCLTCLSLQLYKTKERTSGLWETGKVVFKLSLEFFKRGRCLFSQNTIWIFFPSVFFPCVRAHLWPVPDVITRSRCKGFSFIAFSRAHKVDFLLLPCWGFWFPHLDRGQPTSPSLPSCPR